MVMLDEVSDKKERRAISVILIHHLAHLFFDGLLHAYGFHLSSLFAHPDSDRAPNSARCRESRSAAATGTPQLEYSPAATAAVGSTLLGASRNSGRIGGRS
jgi:hypothetical protein